MIVMVCLDLLHDMCLLRLPEMPPDTRENNPVLRTDVIPKFSELTPAKVVAGGAKLAMQYEVELSKHIKKLEGM